MHSDELFEAEMAGVTPLKREARERVVKSGSQGDDAARRRAAEGTEEGATNRLVDEGIEPLDAWYVLDFKRAGIQNGVYRKLRQGRYDIDARLDLHRMTVKQAREEVHAFVCESMTISLHY